MKSDLICFRTSTELFHQIRLGVVLVVLFLVLFTGTVSAESGTSVIAGKDCPVVLVHGFMGWGREEMGGYLYWGGFYDIEKMIAEHGFKTITASVGPISSVHDRACELFWQLRGGLVDYGEEHSRKFSHKRFGRKYKAKFPDWSEKRPVHMIGHSMGGQTIRYLAELLAQDYFKQGTNERWILSVTTISTPNNGTTLATIVNRVFWNMAEELLVGLNALANGSIDMAYDFDLHQWGITRKKNESMRGHLKRILASVGDTQDISSYDLAPEGAHKLNEVIRVFPDIYYLSYSNSSTINAPLVGISISRRLKINPALYLSADFMGTYSGNAIPEKRLRLWRENDGIVNTVSMAGPDNSKIVRHKPGKSFRKGVWTDMGLTDNTDHLQIVGHYVLDEKWLKSFYSDIAGNLMKMRR